jgi:hypothetical protein
MDIRLYGKDAKTDFYILGNEGKGIRKTRRLFPDGPVGEIIWGIEEKFLYIEFKAKDLLVFVDAITSLEESMHSFITEKTEFGTVCKAGMIDLKDMPKLKSYICDIEIDDDLLALLHNESKGYLYYAISGLLKITRVAQSRHWMSVNLNNWAEKSFL